MLPTTTETAAQLRDRLVIDYNARADLHDRHGLTNLAVTYRALACTVAAMEVGQ